ncbi:MAG TPA: hypothetical protein VF486_21770 [Actinomycetes bacterium]
MRGPYPPDRYWMGGPPFWLELIGWLLFLALLAAAVALVVWTILRLTGRRGGAAGGPPPGWSPEWSRPAPDPALQAVRLRYAQGELTPEQYARLVHDLGGQVPGPPSPPPGPAPGPSPDAPTTPGPGRA